MKVYSCETKPNQSKHNQMICCEILVEVTSLTVKNIIKMQRLI